MTTLYGGPIPPNFTDGEQLTAAGFNAVKNYWVIDGELPEDAEDGDVVFAIVTRISDTVWFVAGGGNPSKIGPFIMTQSLLGSGDYYA